MPIVIISWFNEPNEPRSSVGANSDKYTGTVAIEPQARPMTIRPRTNIVTLGAIAKINAPNAKIIAINSTKRRRQSYLIAARYYLHQ